MGSSELKTYHGNCHCGDYRFSVKLPEIKKVEDCNCCYCVKVYTTNTASIIYSVMMLITYQVAYVFINPAEAEHFVVERGENTLKNYEFGEKIKTHKVRLARPLTSKGS